MSAPVLDPADGAPRTRLLASVAAGQQSHTARRYAEHGAILHAALARLYGDQPCFDGWYGALLEAVGASHRRRAPALLALDAQREAAPDWFCDPAMLGYCCYVEQFGGSFDGVGRRVDYLAELGVRYLHLLPFLRARAGESDGGFAVSSFTQVDPALGSNADLQALCTRLRAAGISLCADLVLNHVADDHPWAAAAAAGDPAMGRFFHVLSERSLVDQYEAGLAQVFPVAAPGNFSRVEALDAWVWTTFYPFQWDLNYANPEVFKAMVEAMLELANMGIEVFRLDSIAYLWKRIDTACTNQPEVHLVLQALRAIIAIAAPAVLLKAEAIMPTAELPAYFGQPGAPACHLAYHSTLMAASWAAIAEQNTAVLRKVIEATPSLPETASWLTYVRCHDDIGWGILHSEAGSLARLRAVAHFFHGETGGFAAGVAFQAADARPVTGTNGMAASLAGLERAVNSAARAAALDRLGLLYGLAMAFGGLPVVYMGDELGMANDAQAAAAHGADTRWVQRGRIDPQRIAARHEAGSNAQALFGTLRRYAALRAALPALAAGAPRRLLPCGEPGLLALERGTGVLCLFNFSDRGSVATAQELDAAEDLALGPWSMLWLARQPGGSFARLA